ncbi:hypothetical protein [Alsobacter ponti]|nr:hypothetical protein [Alsobacter ponti]
MMDLMNLRILVVEDELLIALAMEDMLQTFGCEIIGPASDIGEAEKIILKERLDGALLDVNVRGRLVYPVAEMLIERSIPLILCSGYATTNVIPAPYCALPQIAKPYDQDTLYRMMTRVFADTEARTPPAAWARPFDRSGELSG